MSNEVPTGVYAEEAVDFSSPRKRVMAGLLRVERREGAIITLPVVCNGKERD